MGPMKFLAKNYLKTSFENPEISHFVLTFWNSLRVKFSLKINMVFELWKYIFWEVVMPGKINEPILKSAYQRFSFDGTMKF